MKTSVRGMAKVSVVWTILVLVAFLVAIVMFFLNNGELEKRTLQLKDLEAKHAQLEKANRADTVTTVGISEYVGFVDASKSNKSDPDTIKSALEQLKKDLPDVIDGGTKTLQNAVPLLVTAAKGARERAKDLDDQLKTKMGEVDSLQKSLRETVDAKEKEISDLRRQLTDSDTQKTDIQKGYETQLAELREQLKTKNAEVQSANTTIATNLRTFTNESEGLRSRMTEMGRKLNPIVKEPQSADGKVLAVSKDLGLGWIDLGAKNRLPVGTKFTVVSGVAGSTRVKAMAEVTKVEGDMAEVSFADQRDPFDPPTTGDVVYNPVYDPRGERNALFIGAFSGTWGEDQLKNLLGSMGISIQKKLDQATDFLIVGSEMYSDPETKQPVETPIQPSDLPVYKEAVAMGVQIVLLKDLRNYFRF